MSINDIKNKIIPILRRNSISRAAVFGSYARGEERKMGKIYLIGNPIIYWFGGLGIIFLLLYIIFQKFDRNDNYKKQRGLIIFLLGGYLLNFLPFILIGRVMFLYHYSVSLVFSIIIISFLIDTIKSLKLKKRAAVIFILSATLSFVYWSPLSYGLPISEKESQERFWFKSWQ